MNLFHIYLHYNFENCTCKNICLNDHNANHNHNIM